MKADVAIVIVSYNSEDHIEACLESVFAQKKSVNQQVIVVDNDSRDGTVELIRRKFPEVELVIPGSNLGFAAGVNLGVKHADAEFVLLLNPDTEILDHAVDVVVEFARKNPGHGLYGGRTLRPDGSLEPSSCWGLPLALEHDLVCLRADDSRPEEPLARSRIAGKLEAGHGS